MRIRKEQIQRDGMTGTSSLVDYCWAESSRRASSPFFGTQEYFSSSFFPIQLGRVTKNNSYHYNNISEDGKRPNSKMSSIRFSVEGRCIVP